MYFHWASYHEETKGLRPKDPVGHGTVDGISSSYKFYMERDCHVLMWKYSFWYHACRRVARRTAEALGASFKVSGGPRRELQGQRVRAHWPLLRMDEQYVRLEERQRRRRCGEQANPGARP